MLEAEKAGEVIPVGETGSQGDFRDRQACGAQKFLGVGQTQVLQISLCGHADFAAEKLQQVVGGDPQGSGNSGKFQLRIMEFFIQ